DARRSGGADAHVEHAVAPECDPRCLGIDCAGAEDVAHIFKCGSVPSPASEDGLPLPFADRLVISEVNPFVIAEIRMQSNIHQSLQAARSAGLYGGHTGDRYWRQSRISEKPKTPAAFGNQHGAIRQKCDGPGLLQSFGDDNGA